MSNSSISTKKDEFEMSILIEFLLRNKQSLLIIGFISILISTLYAITKRHTHWPHHHKNELKGHHNNEYIDYWRLGFYWVSCN